MYIIKGKKYFKKQFAQQNTVQTFRKIVALLLADRSQTTVSFWNLEKNIVGRRKQLRVSL